MSLDTDKIRRQADAGHAESQFLLSQLSLQNGDLDAMAHWLREASANGIADAQAALGHCHERGLGMIRDYAAALEMYDVAVASQSPVAAYRKAELLYKSSLVTGHLDSIRSLLQVAAAAGFEPALRTVAYLNAQCGRRSTELGEDVPLIPEIRDLDRQQVNDEPGIAVFSRVLDAQDCAYLINLSRPYLTSSDVIDPNSERDGMRSTVRTSSGTYLPFQLVDFIARYIELKIVQATGESLENSEPMSILCYAPGQYYQPHFDYFDPKLPVSAGLLEDGGQRTASAVTYLAVPDAGGGTSFPNLDLTVPPQPGATLWFRNCHANGSIDPRSLHAGDPVERGSKWVVTKWYREGRTRYLEL
ncbi:MAG: 2OG-Fe(II) oxygenase [Woeseiaceae bacterium]|nr:2OG-Fe(II) oxygenase [Woeseiaceae bacterium]